MTRMIWIVRLLALLIFLVLTFLMVDLYAKLRRMSASQPPPRTAAPRTR